MDWKKEAERMKFQQGQSWAEIAKSLKPCFPGLSDIQIREKIRGYVRNLPRYKIQKPIDENRLKESVEYNAKDNTTTRDKLIEICEGTEITPEVMLKAHGLDPQKWKILNYKNNYWHSQVKGGKRLLMYQSKITVRPYADDEISFDEVKKWFSEFERSYTPPKINYIKHAPRQMLEVNIADLHLGKLAWRGECGEDYDFKIASERYNYIIDDICSRVNRESIEKIILPIGNDFFNSDTVDNTTTKGTQQTNDLRWRKMFKIGLGLQIVGIDKLSTIAPIEVFDVTANHDEMASFYCICAIAEHFANYKNVSVVTNGTPRYYVEYFNNLIGFSHGDEDKSKILKLMQVEAREAWGRTQFHEFHTAHVHSENAKEDGGLIWRTTSSTTGPDYWHVKSGFIGAVKKSQNFVYDREKGLIEIINSVI